MDGSADRGAGPPIFGRRAGVTIQIAIQTARVVTTSSQQRCVEMGISVSDKRLRALTGCWSWAPAPPTAHCRWMALARAQDSPGPIAADPGTGHARSGDLLRRYNGVLRVCPRSGGGPSPGPEQNHRGCAAGPARLGTATQAVGRLTAIKGAAAGEDPAIGPWPGTSRDYINLSNPLANSRVAPSFPGSGCPRRGPQWALGTSWSASRWDGALVDWTHDCN